MRSQLRTRALDATCPGCGSAQVRLVGAIPVADTFAGRVRTGTLEASQLAHCSSCTLRFRWPTPDQDTLDELYRAGVDDTWTVAAETRADWAIARDWVTELDIRDVLDVGCFDGGFLGLLDPARRRAGIEMQPDAAARAAATGIDIVGEDFEQLAGRGELTDCAVAFDVLEHVLDPSRFLRILADATRADGYVIVATGSTTALTWRLMGSRYWYCWLPEHVSFVNPDWLVQQGRLCGLRVERTVRFSHAGQSRRQRVSETVKNLAYRVAPRPLAVARGWAGRRAGRADRPAIDGSPPSWMSAKDHVIVLFCKSGTGTGGADPDVPSRGTGGA